MGNGNIPRAERPRGGKSANYASGEMIKEPEEKKFCLKKKKSLKQQINNLPNWSSLFISLSVPTLGTSPL